MKGSILLPEKMEIKIEDILPMDVGNGTYTEYTIDERYVNFIMEDEKRMEWKMGHIHSHHSMGVFFSGTDQEELTENSKAHNFYLSLIVNNFMEMKARVGITAYVEHQTEPLSFMALDENGKKYSMEKKAFKIKKEQMYYYDCDIISKAEKIKVPVSFANKVKGIIEAKIFNRKKEEENHQKLIQENKAVFPNNPFNTPFSNPNRRVYPNIVEDLSDNDEEDLYNLEIDFTIAVLHCGTKPLPNADLEQTLVDLEIFQVNEKELAEKVIANYVEIYEEMYGIFHKNDKGLFIETTESLINNLRDWEDYYPVIKLTIDSLDQLLVKFDSYGTTVR